MQKILVLNSGSSSLKYQLFSVDGDKYTPIAKGLADRIGIEGSYVTIKIGDGDKIVDNVALPTHKEAIREVLAMLLRGALKSIDELSGVGHRVVAGGEYFKESALVTDKVIDQVDELSILAPLHNPAAAMGLRAMKSLLPDIKQVVVFDTAFHQTMDKAAYLYPLPLEQYKKYKIRRYGAHGTSHYYVSREAARLMGKQGKIITCHIGNGASISAVDNGKCVDTSMGFTPLAGICMGTRCGDIDPYIPLHIFKTQHKSIDEVNNLLNKESGMLGLCGYSDNRDVEAAIAKGDEDAIAANEVYIHSILRFIGSYIAVLGGVDAIVFTAGVGENSPALRKALCDRLSYLGIEIDEAANNKRGETIEITKPNSKVHVYVIPTDEELVIAQDTVRLIK
ncbi:MAG: acetate kinase [Alphaproteobacteria bacterium]|nr:acetate kinase [Alphaproteobacteria bacterium]MBQ8677677.1 acetate kinase [Alphaproteobacteria bacterium]